MSIYVASSWRNLYQPWVVRMIRDAGHEVYDFRTTKPEDEVFSWDQISYNWENWDFPAFYQALDHPLAVEAYTNDVGALQAADVGIMVMPCGASSHLEIGYLAGMGKPTAIFMLEGRPELMYKTADLITDKFPAILDWLQALKEKV